MVAAAGGKTHVAYRPQVRQYGFYLAQHLQTRDDPLHTPFASVYAVRDYKTYLKIERRAKPSSVNLALAAIDRFHQFIGNDRPQVQRENLHTQANCILPIIEGLMVPWVVQLLYARYLAQIIRSVSEARVNALAGGNR